jgi:hypothetical protein
VPTFFENQTEDTEVVKDWNGNGTPGGIQLEGTWGGATITVTCSYNSGLSYTDPVLSTFTSDYLDDFQSATGKIKITLSGATATTKLNAHISPG